MSNEPKLSRREREIMNALFRHGEATVADVLASLESPPSYSAVRATLGILEDKGHVKHHKSGRRFMYTAAVSRNSAAKSALEQLLSTFFDGSPEGAVRTLLEMESSELSDEQLEKIQKLIEQARKEGR